MGDFKTEEMGVEDSFINYLLYLLFIGIMTIIILNLLVGIAVGEIKQTLDEADIQQLSIRIIFVLKIQNSLKLIQKIKCFGRLFNMDYDHYDKKKRAKSYSQNIKNAYKYIKVKLLYNGPEINLVNPQERLEESLKNLSEITNKNLNTIKDTMKSQNLVVNENLNKTKQRLEDTLLEMSRISSSNFEITAEDSSTALLNLEETLFQKQTNIENRVVSLELLTQLKFNSTKDSLIHHIKNSTNANTVYFKNILDKLNIMCNLDLSVITESGNEIKAHTHSELQTLIKMFQTIEKRMSRVEKTLEFYVQVNKLS